MTRQTPLHRDDFPVLTDVQTRWSDNDVYGHLNNAIHYRLFDTVLNDWLIGNQLIDPAKSDLITMVVETGCSYFAELAYPQTIVAGLRADRIGRTSITYRFALFGDSDRAAAQGHLTHVLVDRATHQPCVLPDRWVNALQQLRTPRARTGQSIPKDPHPTQETIQ